MSWVPATPLGQANNRFRSRLLTRESDLKGDRVVATPGVISAFENRMLELLSRVKRFPDDQFHTDFDPHGDRDMIVFDTLEPEVWARIDCYGLDMETASEDPCDDNKTVRVLTLMLPEEY